MIDEYSHPAFLDSLSTQLQYDVLRFIYTGQASEILHKELLSNQYLRNCIDEMLDEELRKYEKN